MKMTTATIMNEFLKFAVEGYSKATQNRQYVAGKVESLLKHAEDDPYLANNKEFMQVARKLNERLTMEELSNICMQLPRLQTEYSKWLANQKM
jgi:methyltransferase-like protein